MFRHTVRALIRLMFASTYPYFHKREHISLISNECTQTSVLQNITMETTAHCFIDESPFIVFSLKLRKYCTVLIRERATLAYVNNYQNDIGKWGGNGKQ